MKKVFALLLVLTMVLAVPALASATDALKPAGPIGETETDFFIYPVAEETPVDPDAPVDPDVTPDIPAAGVATAAGIALVIATLGCAILPKK